MQLQNKVQSKERKCRPRNIWNKGNSLGLGVTEEGGQRKFYLEKKCLSWE